MSTILLQSYNRNGFNVKSEIRENFNRTNHWLYFEFYKNGNLVYNDSGENDNDTLKRVYLYTDSENYKDEINKKQRWKNVANILNLESLKK